MTRVLKAAPGLHMFFYLTFTMFKQKIALHLKTERFHIKMQISGSSALDSHSHMVTVSGREVKSDCPFRWTTSCPVHLSLFSAFMFPAWTLSASGFQRWLHIRTPGDL